MIHVDDMHWHLWEAIFGKEQTVKSLPGPMAQQRPDSWYLGDGEDYQ